MRQDTPVVVFGGSGFVGRHLVPAVVRRTGGVTTVSRRAGLAGPGVHPVEGDLADPAALASRLPRGAVVINLAYDPKGGLASNLALADGLADVCRRIDAARLVHVSTAMVVGVVEQRWVDERTPCRPRTSYQKDKLAIEERLEERLGGSRPMVVIRPTAVFGEGGLNLRKLFNDLTTQPTSRNYLRACLFGERPLNLVPVETVVAAVLFAAESVAALDDRVYFIADDENPDNNYRYVDGAMHRGLGIPPYPVPPVSFPQSLLRLVLRATGRLSFDPRTRFSSARITAAGFTRPLTLNEAIERYVKHLRDDAPTT